MPALGQTCGYRPIPRDFAETFARVGWEGICEEYRAHKTTVKRWMVEHGEDGLRQGRRDYLTAIYSARGHSIPGRKPGTAARYVMGRTRVAIGSLQVEMI